MTKIARMLEPSGHALRREFAAEFRREAVQMMLDGLRAASVAERLGLSGTNLLYRWKREHLERSGSVVTSLEARVRDLDVQLQRVERDILKKRWLFSAGTSERGLSGRRGHRTSGRLSDHIGLRGLGRVSVDVLRRA